MTADLEVRKLVNFETATDGTAVRLIVEHSVGQSVGIIFTIETLTALLMTLPTMASNAVKRTHNDPAPGIRASLRLERRVASTCHSVSPKSFPKDSGALTSREKASAR